MTLDLQAYAEATDFSWTLLIYTRLSHKPTTEPAKSETCDKMVTRCAVDQVVVAIMTG